MNSNPIRSTGDGPETLIRLSGARRSFPSGDGVIEVLRGVELEVRAGDFLVLVGPSGSGKSTMLNLIGGLDQPTAGEAWFQRQPLHAASAKQLTKYRREHVGFVFQFYNLIPTLTARENVQTAAELVDEALPVDELLNHVGLGDRLDHFPAQLSGGEQQRVAMARALAKNPTLLLCDEPTGALDIASGRKALEVLVDLNHRLQKTIVLITHNSAIAAVGNRVAVMRDGVIVEDRANAAPTAPAELDW